MSRFLVVCAAMDVPAVELDVEAGILAEIDAELVDLRGKPLAALESELASADAILTEALFRERFDAACIDRLERCRVISVAAVGADGVDIAAAAARGITVTNVPSYCTTDVAEHTLTLLLAAWRKLPRAMGVGSHSGDWSIEPLRPVWRLSGRTVGLVGFGRIARAVTERLRAFGVEVIAHDPYADPTAAADLGVRLCPLPDLLAASDAISIHLPLTDETRGLIGEEQLAMLRPDATVVNVGRGGVVEETALLAALDGGIVGAAALDVLAIEPPEVSHPLLSHPRVIVTPHMAYYSEDSLYDLRAAVARNAALVLSGQPPLSQVAPPGNG